MVAASILSSASYQVPWQTTGLADISSAALFVFGKWCHVRCSYLFKLFVNSKFIDCFHFPILWHFPFHLMHVPIRFPPLTVTSPMLPTFRIAFLINFQKMRFISFFIQEHPVKTVMDSWTIIILFSSSHFHCFRSWVHLQPSYFIILALCTNSRLCTLCIFHTTDTKYVLFMKITKRQNDPWWHLAKVKKKENNKCFTESVKEDINNKKWFNEHSLNENTKHTT